MALANPYQQYKEQSLTTLSPGELLIKLYEEAIKQMSLAKIKIKQNDLSGANTALAKSQTIISTLADSLDMRYPISKELREMYIFIAQYLTQANVKKDIKMIDDCIPLVRDMRDAFEQAGKLSRAAAPAQAMAGGRAV
ncbi:MAG: flagellar export chaperone FliS [Oscillospiraceae bacterium]|nr:flagellar export chaperone FliS [Oscillospiraceae bacterium]